MATSFFCNNSTDIFSVKEKRQRKFESLEGESISYVWTAFGVAIFIVSFYNSRYGSNESSTLFMVLYGIPTFITGGMMKFKPMIFGGLVCWLFSIISVYTPVNVDLLLMAGCGLFAWLIPGIVLWRRYQKRKLEQDGI
jgi:ABC-type phosphate transport system permease subunit